MTRKHASWKKERMTLFLLYGALIVGILVLGFSVKSFIARSSDHSQATGEQSHLAFTSFDKELARELMDKDHDGKCDACGMPVEMCIGGGQMECTMANKGGIGILNSDHIHADWKIYVNNKFIDLSGMAHMDRMAQGKPVSSFMHVDSGSPAPEQIGDVLHMHAEHVPLWLFFESVGMKLTKDCITLENDEQYCNDGKHKLRMYVNGAEHDEFGGYIFHDLDKILITYGDDESVIPQQLASITEFAKDH